MIFLIYYLFLSHIKRYKLILQAYKKYKVVEVGLATTFLAKSVMFLRACALCTGTVQVQKYSDWLSPAKNQHDWGSEVTNHVRAESAEGSFLKVVNDIACERLPP